MKQAAQKKNYLEVFYNQSKLPGTVYPQKLATYFYDKFFDNKSPSLLASLLPCPFRPLYKSSVREPMNKWVGFSKEKMLLVFGEKK